MRYSQLIAGLTLATCSSFASAGLVIDSINVQMVSTKFSARTAKGTDQERYSAAVTAFESSKGSVCSEDLDALEGVSYRGTCGGTRNDYGALYTITGSLTGVAEFEFGLDWGRGGFIVADSKGASLEYANDDIWWGKNWNNSKEILTYNLENAGDFTLTLLGFEGCCDGINSGRYRTWDTAEISTLNEPTPTEWTTLEVNAVPVPGSLPLMAVGALLMLSRTKRRQS